MNRPTAFTAALLSLTEALDDPAVDVQLLLDALAEDARRVVPSYLGLSITVVADGGPVGVTIVGGAGDDSSRHTSIRIPLSALKAATEPGTAIVLYASAPGAFVDLAADIAYQLGRELDDIVVTDAATGLLRGSAVIGLDELSIVNQAVGVLIDTGRTSEGARAELRRDADLARSSVPSAARLVVAATAALPVEEHHGSC